MSVSAYPVRRMPMETLHGADSAVTVHDYGMQGRFGIKGRGACDWLAMEGYMPPDRINTMRRDVQGVDIMRLGNEDFLVVGSVDADRSALDRFRTRWLDSTVERKGYNSYREEVWGWLHLCGPDVAAFMAQTCPVDLREDALALDAVAQTRVAQMDCVLVRSDRSGLCGFDVFFDVASTAFLYQSLAVLLDENDNILI